MTQFVGSKRELLDTEFMPLMSQVNDLAVKYGIPYLAIFDLDKVYDSEGEVQGTEVGVSQNLAGYNYEDLSPALSRAVISVLIDAQADPNVEVGE